MSVSASGRRCRRDPQRPVVCFDESPIQLIGEVHEPVPCAPGQIERYDCEYRRNGTANLSVFLDANRPWRRVKVTERRGADFAVCKPERVFFAPAGNAPHLVSAAIFSLPGGRIRVEIRSKAERAGCVFDHSRRACRAAFDRSVLEFAHR
jgi:hypothetical protein